MTSRTSIASLLAPFLLGLSLPLSMTSASAQLPPLAYDEGSLGLAFALRKLPVTATFLQITAHPDAEDNSLLVMLSRSREK